MTRKWLVVCALVLLFAFGCDNPESDLALAPPTEVVVTPEATATANPTATVMPSATPTATATATPSPTATATATPTPTATPDPYAGYTIEDLRSREYGGGELVVERVLATTDAFTRTLITYPSDGLTIYGFMNVPAGEGPFPVAMVLHGYIDPDVYDTLAYTTRYADALARAGYVVLHPNLRGYPPSDSGPNLYRVGMAVDVLNLAALVRQQAGQPGPLAQADADFIGLMGHSMGGGITWRVITVDPDIDAAVLYGGMHPDEAQNNAWRAWRWGGERTTPEMDTPAEDLARISPASYLHEIDIPLELHHSTIDESVPVEWSAELAARMEELGKSVALYLYDNTPHTFRGEADALFMQRMIAHFDAVARPPEE